LGKVNFLTTSNSYTNEKKWKIAALYKFVNLKNVTKKRDHLEEVCKKQNILGTLILANEGINGTITGESEAVDLVLDEIKKWPEISRLDVKYSSSNIFNFKRLKIKQKKRNCYYG
jgi:UPF0176 protein